MGSYLPSLRPTDDPVANARRARGHAEPSEARTARDEFESQIEALGTSVETIDARIADVLEADPADDAGQERQRILFEALTTKREALLHRIEVRTGQLDAISASGNKVDDAAAAALAMTQRQKDLAKTKDVLNKSGFSDPAKTKAMVEDEAKVARQVDALAAIPGYASTGQGAYVPTTAGGKAAARKVKQSDFAAQKAAYRAAHAPVRPSVGSSYRAPVLTAASATGGGGEAAEVATGEFGAGELRMF